MGVCGENTRHFVSWCVLPEGHDGGHRGVVALAPAGPAVVAWHAVEGEVPSYPVIVQVRA